MKGLCVALCLASAAAASGEPAARQDTLRIGESIIHIESDVDLPLPPPVITDWVNRAAVAVSNYFGHFPVKTLYVGVHAEAGRAVGGGVTHGASRIDVRLGPDAQSEDLREDWIMTHEMFHLAFPTLKERYLWMMEGLSDYLEPVARARVGQLTARHVWREFVEGLPQGLPKANDHGLDNSGNRERIYWGGNLFWLLADVQIRVRTGNRHNVDDTPFGPFSMRAATATPIGASEQESYASVTKRPEQPFSKSCTPSLAPSAATSTSTRFGRR